MNRIVIRKAEYTDLEKVIDEIFHKFPLDIENRKVLIKPNVLRASMPEEAITTHPALVEAVVRKVELLKPSEITVGDNPGITDYGANEKAFAISGIMKAACGFYKNIGLEAVQIPFGKFGYEYIPISKSVMEADIIISLPKFKTHGLTTISGAIKNSYGIIPGATKARLHKAAGDEFHKLLVEVFKIRIPDLFILDGITAMEGNGPASRDLRHLGVIMAARNAVALDGAMAYTILEFPRKIKHLEYARELGLGDYRWENISIDGDMEFIPDFKLPPSTSTSLSNPAFREQMRKKMSALPKADPELCNSCGQCIRSCPADALRMEDYPTADASTCITCYCCQEVCPSKAISITYVDPSSSGDKSH